MEVSEKHPEYAARFPEWQLCMAAYDGETAIKAAGEAYLPMPSGYSIMADRGRRAYDAYRGRALFPDVMAASIGAMLGIIHDEEIEIEMPAALDYIREDADGRGFTLEDFHRRVTRELLVMGRFGILADAPPGGGAPYLAGYKAPSIINWDDGFYVLDETGPVRDGFSWTRVEQYRVLQVVDGAYQQTVYTEAGLVEDTTPTRRGGALVDAVPFVLAGSKDLGADVETPPLIGVARASLAMYQLAADYRHQLYMSGQETLVVINGDAPSAVGAGVVHEMKGGGDIVPDMKYVSPSCAGIDAHLSAIEHNRDAAVQAGARLFEQSRQAQESGEARKMRFRSETANLQTVAAASCAALERALRYAALLAGLGDAEITVTPPTDLLETTMTPADAAALWQIAKDGGMPYQTFYENLARGGIASPERDHNEEFALLDGEAFSRGEAA